MASPREVQAFLTCCFNKEDDGYTVTKALGKIPQEDLAVYAFCPLSKRGNAEHMICRGINTLHHYPRTPWAITSTRWMCKRQPTTLGLGCKAREGQQTPRTMLKGLQFTARASSSSFLLVYQYGGPPPNLMDWGSANATFSFYFLS